ncbi:MAG: hypothetical protein IKG01_13680 [Lachnospiraceae bacterium]|nr:hypothetical protein [Lachnospiraceae bacterium]
MSTKARRATYEDNVQPYLKQISEWVEQGCTKKAIAENLKVPEGTFYAYLKRHSELREAFTRAQVVPNEKVENALFKRACGYQWTETKVKQALDRNGNIVELTETRTVDVAPDPTSIIFWLTNMMRDKWKKMPEETDLSALTDNALCIIPKREIVQEMKKISKKAKKHE